MPKNLYERNGIYYARIQVAGTERRVSLKTKDRREAERRRKAFLEDNSPYHGTTRRSFDDVMDGYLLEAEGRVKPKTYKRYEVSALQLGNKFTGMWWDQITKKSVVDYIDERKAAKVKIPTIKRDLTVLSQAAEWAIEHDCGGVNPVSQLGKRQLTYKRWKMTRPNAQSVEATIDHAYGNLKPLARFLLHTGLRLDEAVTLRWDDVNVARKVVMVVESKNGLPRAVMLSEAALAVLSAQAKKNEFVFPTRDGATYKQASTNWQEAKKSAQKTAQKDGWRYTPFRLHDLRHIYAIDYLVNGGNLYWLQRQLGHSTIRQTEEYLDYLTPEEVEQVKKQAGTETGTNPNGSQLQ
jgi:integrase